jgi:hypothetical protein
MRALFALLFALLAGVAQAQVTPGTSPLSIPKGGTAGGTASAARTNLGVTATGADTTYAYRANNLSDLANIATARGNLIPANSLTLSQFPTIGANTFIGSVAGGTPVALAIPGSCTRMWPTSNFIGNWNVIDAYGNAVSTSGSTSQGLQEAINFSINNGQCLQVYGQGTLALGNQSATLNSTTTVAGLTSTANLLVGDYVVASAGGIPLFTKIASIDSGTQIHISNAATVSAARTLTFTRGAGANRSSQISTSAPIQIPPVEQWAFEAYEVNLTCATSVNAACIQFDSAIIMGFDWIGGQIVYMPSAPTANSFAVLVAPINPVPLDGVVAFSDSHIFISNIASPASGGAAQADIGVSINGGTVANVRFAFNELNGTGTGSSGNTTSNFLVFGATPSTAFEQNIIDIAHAHLSLGPAIQIGVNSTNAGSYRHNLYRIGGIKPSGASSAAISSWGAYDTFQIGGITNEEGTLLQGINLQSSSVGNKISYGQIIGAGTALLDGGTCNSWSGANGVKTAMYGTTSGCTTVVPAAVASGILTFPAATDTLVGKATTDTLTNKTFDTAGTGNSFLINGVAATATATAAAGQLPGEPSTGSAAAGKVGEFFNPSVAAGSPIALTTNAPANLTSQSLTAGDWDVTCEANFTPNTTTSITQLMTSISTTSATLNQTPFNVGYYSAPAQVPGVLNMSAPFPRNRISLSTTATVYCVVQATFTVSTLSTWGGLHVRRVR